METPEPVNTDAVPSQRNRRNLFLALAGIVLCCGCLAIVGIGLYSLSAIRDVQTEVFPSEESTPAVQEDSLTPASDTGPVFGIGDPPAGGLGNDVLREDTWQTVGFAAIGRGCDRPVAEDSTIEVLQEPDANGVWVEKWTVACASGDSYPYEVEYILDATGATFNIRSIPE